MGSTLTSRTNGPLGSGGRTEDRAGDPGCVRAAPWNPAPAVTAAAASPGWAVRVRPDGARRAAPRAALVVARAFDPARPPAARAERESVLAPDEAAATAAGCDVPPRGAAARDASVDGEPECEPDGDPPPTGGVTVVDTGSDGVLTVGVLMLSCGVVTVTVATDGTVTGSVAEGTVADGTLTDGTLTDGTETDGTLTDGTETDGAGTLPSATAADAPAAATSAPPATSEPLTVRRVTPAPRTAFA